MAIDATTRNSEALQLSSSPQQVQARPPADSKSSFWQELIAHAASAAGIDPHLAVSVAAHESGLNPKAVNPSSGAVGIMQLMPGTATALGVDPHDVVANIQGGIHYLRQQLTHFGDEAKALAAYNWGPHHVAQAVEQWGADWLSHAPSETQHYVSSILARTGTIGASGMQAGASSESRSSATASSPLTTHPSLTLAAELANVRSAFDAYLLSQILS